ncbi:aconitate hydratase [Sutterella sp.]|uniref:aconitate hydratase n=1 Tax=Sutterella sp. TaxID=1981025 RepID=UPI0026E0720D|nr:aconitate hydratase [Sutterella sp.]MDO5530989.1 aconitate hydratase [Sutterella sp.]
MSEKKFTISRRSLLKTAAAASAAASVPVLGSTAHASTAPETAHIRDFAMIEAFYRDYPKRLAAVRGKLGRPLTLAEKVIFTHLYHPESLREFKRGADYIELRPDRAGTHDIGGPMAIIQFLSSGKERIALPAALVCDHLVMANAGAIPDLKVAEKGNYETYDFLARAAKRYGFDFWPAGAGICHQVFMENYNFPGGMMLVTDSHTPTAGGMGMLAIGVGGADLVDGLMGMEWELKMPKLIGVKLTGELSGWTSPKDVILKLTGILSTKGGTNAIIEFFGEGTKALSATGKATICNMGAETGATTSVFPFDDSMVRYLNATGREAVSNLAKGVAADLQADPEVIADPAKYFDRVVEIDLSTLEPHINGPFSPDAAMPINTVAEKQKEKGFPQKLEVALIGSCTNSSYEDITRAASVAKEMLDKGIEVKTPIMVVPGSVRIYQTLERDGLLDVFKKLNATVLATACGPCIGQWHRTTGDMTKPNSIIESFNRNFAGRNDGSTKTAAFLASPEIVMAMAAEGDITFNPLEGSLRSKTGINVRLSAPKGEELPSKGFVSEITGCVLPTYEKISMEVSPTNERIQLLKPFKAWDGKDFAALPLLIKVKGKCTTDHISPGGKWLPYRGNIDRISDNLLERGINAFNGQAGKVWNFETSSYDTPAKVARYYRNHDVSSVIVGDDNYGEGSSREHAAMEPRYLNVAVVLAKSLARIHESNLKKQGVLALTFADPADYDRIREKDRISVLGLASIAPGKTVTVELTHEDGTKEQFQAAHSYNEKQLGWWRAGSALNWIVAEEKKAKA